MNWSLLGKRADTMRFALERLPESPTIVETGCVRTADNWQGDGMSTVVFAEWVDAHGGNLYSVDIDRDNVAQADALTSWSRQVLVVLGDSVPFLANFEQPIDLLYLDSLDYPDGALRDLYGGRDDIHRAMVLLDAMGEDEIVARHGTLILPSQEHCARELDAAMPWLDDRSVVVIDDAALPGGGKARLARKILEREGWRCALDAYQTVWVRA